jgi:hypothetical protein
MDVQNFLLLVVSFQLSNMLGSVVLEFTLLPILHHQDFISFHSLNLINPHIYRGGYLSKLDNHTLFACLILATWFKTKAFDDDDNKDKKKLGAKEYFFVSGANLLDYYKFQGHFAHMSETVLINLKINYILLLSL